VSPVAVRCEGDSAWTRLEKILEEYDDIPTVHELDEAIGPKWRDLSATCSDQGNGDCPWWPLCEVRS
jgi:hypothetical protein